MSDIFTEDLIETLSQWNAVLSAGGCCEMPECLEPSIETQHKYGDGDSDESEATAISLALDALALASYPMDGGGAVGLGDLQVFPYSPDPGALVRAYSSQSRWSLDPSFDGVYFKIEWDVWEWPDGDSVGFLVSSDSWEWTGGSMTSGWTEVLPPSSAGYRKIVNVKYWCYPDSPYGFAKQELGLQVP